MLLMSQVCVCWVRIRSNFDSSRCIKTQFYILSWGNMINTLTSKPAILTSFERSQMQAYCVGRCLCLYGLVKENESEQ